MKKIIAFIMMAFIVFSCAVTAPSWTNYGSDGVYVEYCRDTLSYVQLDSTLNKNDIHPFNKKWDTIKYYNSNGDEITQFVHSKNDTTFIVNKINSKDYIFIKRYLNK